MTKLIAHVTELHELDNEALVEFGQACAEPGAKVEEFELLPGCTVEHPQTGKPFWIPGTKVVAVYIGDHGEAHGLLLEHCRKTNLI